MRIGVQLGASKRLDIDALVGNARDLEARGFATAWIPHVFGFDAVTAAAVVGRETSEIEIGTAVVPTQPRHPTALAQQALTASAACGGRFTLGIGLSHPAVIEGLLGLSYARRAAHMREYLAVLAPLLRGEATSFEGDEFRVQLALAAPEHSRIPLLVAALGDEMLKLAGREADGTILWTTGPRAIEHHIGPKVRAAASEAGRPSPRVVAGMHIVLTSDVDKASRKVGEMLALYAQMPSYRAMLDREGSEDPRELALIGDEQALDSSLQRLKGIGVTDFEACIVPLDDGSRARTLDYLQSVATA